MRRPLWPGVLVGVGLAGTLDEVVLHQLLHWHHFYDRSTNAVGLVSDGLFHLFSTAALVAGVYLLLRGRAAWTPADRRTAIGAALAGAGAFNLYDSLVQHKLLDLHQVRYVEDKLPYDLAFTGIAVAALAAGLGVLRSARKEYG